LTALEVTRNAAILSMLSSSSAIAAILDVVEIGDGLLIAGQTANGAIAPDNGIGIGTGDD